jgi:hypothetical protein
MISLLCFPLKKNTKSEIAVGSYERSEELSAILDEKSCETTYGLRG